MWLKTKPISNPNTNPNPNPTNSIRDSKIASLTLSVTVKGQKLTSLR